MNFHAVKFIAACAGPTASGLICGNSLPQPETSGNNSILNTAFLIGFTLIGAVAFLFLVIGGFRYITAGGNAESVQKAKNQIVYSLVGLVITALAATVVNYVISRFK